MGNPRSGISNETIGPQAFSIEVEIEKLPYVFQGETPQSPTKLTLSIHLPNWQEELARLQGMADFPGKMSTALGRFGRNQGQIGFIHTDLSGSDEADLYIDRVRSETGMLIGTPYQDAKGLGRFLMNNLLTLADVRSWRLSTYPIASGRLSDQQLIEWVERKGFELGRTENLIREPQQPDLSQPIAKLLGISS